MNTVSYDYREQKYYLIEYYYNYRRVSARFFNRVSVRGELGRPYYVFTCKRQHKVG